MVAKPSFLLVGLSSHVRRSCGCRSLALEAQTMIRFPKSFIANGSHLVFRHSLIAVALLSLVVTVLAAPAQAAAGLFQRGKSFRVGAEPFGLAVGDFNG